MDKDDLKYRKTGYFDHPIRTNLQKRLTKC